MVADKSFILFCAALSELAAKNCNVGLGHSESEPFMKRIYAEYLLTRHNEPDISWIKSVPSDVKKWMTNVINESFLFMNEKPKWVRGPSWRFIEDMPMIFISQIEFEKNNVMEQNLSFGDVIYIFSGKQKVDQGWELIIKMVKQDKQSVGTSFIN